MTEQEYIKINDMMPYCIYKCDARNFSYGIWINDRMYYIRYKFGDEFLDFERHYDKDQGTCKPLKRITESLEDRAGWFDEHNWRLRQALTDILLGFSRIIE